MFSPNFSLFFLKEARVRMNYQTDTSKKHHGQELHSENKDRLPFNGKCNLVIPLPELRT